METICAWITLLAGIYFIASTFLITTKNFKSTFLFQIIPFFFGLGNIFVSLKLFNVITLVK